MNSIFYMHKSQEALNSNLYTELMPLHSGNMKFSHFLLFWRLRELVDDKILPWENGVKFEWMLF